MKPDRQPTGKRLPSPLSGWRRVGVMLGLITLLVAVLLVLGLTPQADRNQAIVWAVVLLAGAGTAWLLASIAREALAIPAEVRQWRQSVRQDNTPRPAHFGPLPDPTPPRSSGEPLVADLGVLAYAAGDLTPVAHRQGPLPPGTRYVRPFAVLELPHNARREVSFTLYSGDRAHTLHSEARRKLRQGETVITARLWLPVPDTIDFTQWSLELTVDGDLLTIHDFRQEAGGGALRAHFTGDGELSDELIAALETGGALALDELLQE